MIIKLPGTETSDEPARTPFQAAFDERACDRLAAPDVNLRGFAMALGGFVDGLRIRPASATGTVTEEDMSFDVRLSVSEDGPSYGCTCDEGITGSFCDHAVALALVASGSVDPEAEHGDDDDADGEDLDEELDDDPYGLRPLLSRLTRGELVDLVMDIADDDEDLAHDLVTILNDEHERLSDQLAPR